MLLLRNKTVLQNRWEECKMFANKMKMGDRTRMGHINICKFFGVILMIILSCQSIALITNFCFFIWNSPDQIYITYLGSSVKIQALFGYFQLPFQLLPDSDLEVSARALGAGIAVITLLSEKIPLFFVLWKSMRIFQNMVQFHSPLCDEICRKIKEIGWIIIYFGLLQQLIFQVGVSMISYHKLWFENPVNLALVFAGGVVLLVGDIFTYGCELQKESDELL